MNLEKILNDYKEAMKTVPGEQNIRETVKKSISAYYSAEQECPLTYAEFLWAQLRLMRKRWWFFQTLLLSVLWAVLPSVQSQQRMQRIFGIIASLFIILIIPELWKSQTYHSMEIEAASYYSLRQIYAARILLFGTVDAVLIILFCGLTTITINILLSQLLIQFIFPMVVTATICFGILCSKYPFSETTAVMMCIVWSALWLLIVLNENIYAAITFPLWLTFIGIALVFLTFTIYRTLHYCRDYLEVNLNGIDIR